MNQNASKISLISALTLSLLAAPISGAYANSSEAQSRAVPVAVSTTNITTRFAPRPSRKVRLDYERWDLFLQGSVLFMGPSIRQRASLPKAFTGTRFKRRHTSPYRLEGNKIAYSTFNNRQKTILREYVEDLERLSADYDIATLPRDEQLAFWFNLHNAALVHHISENYPAREPHKIRPIRGDKATLHDAKILTISGVPLSLRDIREKIVFAHWDNALVIYGFHHGDLGGPSIPAIAFEGNNLVENLVRNGQEFTNSLRGYDDGRVSSFYRDMSPFYFKSFDSDLRAHYKRYMRPEVYAEVEATPDFRFHRPMQVVADLTGGYGDRAYDPNLNINGFGASTGLPQAAVEFVEARNNKIRIAIDRDIFSYGTVIIEDIETIDPDLAKPETDQP